MKKALVEYTGYVKEVVDPGQDYQIFSGEGCAMQWVDAPDDVSVFWTLEFSPKKNGMVWVERDLPYHDPVLRRQIAYGRLDIQLAMLYDDIKAGNLENGSWIQHCEKVKADNPKPSDDDYQRYQDKIDENIDLGSSEPEPSPSLQAKISTMDLPAWQRYEGWHKPEE